MAGANSYPSLLPCLETGNGRFRLNIALLSNEQSALESSYPFPDLAGSGPFGRIVAGNILTDAGSPIRTVFLLRQPDEYPDLSDHIRPVLNPDIDRFWQEAYHWYRSGAVNSSVPNTLFLLAGQKDADDRLLPCRSLFYCLFRETYFHPLCPQCGRALDLCRSDEILQAAGLKPYSRSLKRYLYCPDCVRKADAATYYVFALQVDDPLSLKDRWGLIHDLGNLLVKPDLEDRFPCSTCPEQIACYGPDDLSAGRIVPFAFYPFYLMVFEAATVHAMDFLALLSGAPVSQLVQHVTDVGRRRALEAASTRLSTSSRFLFNKSDPKHFLEVLFLKLSFLGELTARVLHAGCSLEYPGLPISLNSVWVKLPDQTGLLPRLWNFRSMRFDVGYGRAELPGSSSATGLSGLYQIAMVWFYALLVNKSQDIRQVAELLDRLCRKLLSSTAPISQLLFQEVNPSAFRPENTFWNPADHTVEPQHESFWQQALHLGASLLRAGLDREVPWSRESFDLQFEALRQSVQQTLFSGTQAAESAGASGGDTAILGILENLSNKWRSMMGQTAIASEVEERMPISKRTAEDKDIGAAVPRSEDDLIHETVLLSSRQSIPGLAEYKTTRSEPSEPNPAESFVGSSMEECLEKTMIQQSVDPGVTNTGYPTDDDALEKTIIMKPWAEKDKISVPDVEDDLSKTIIMKPETGKTK